jgi:alpha-tubulin suppressor-like RCC1 family protein
LLLLACAALPTSFLIRPFYIQLIDVLANNSHVVTKCDAGFQTVVCSTFGAQTVAWGQGPHGELGLKNQKSSSKPAFVELLDSVRVIDLACGYGSSIFVVSADDKEDKEALKKITTVNTDDLASLVEAAEARQRK